jgi:heme exporter protein A|tara:strand:+ start:82 stop:894 length:813 start_codon:yes stop_codon:yes gene_type:complete
MIELPSADSLSDSDEWLKYLEEQQIMAEASSALPAWAIKAEGLTKSFGNHLTLRGIDLEVEWGESLVIFGPNGAGKTTLLKILATIMNLSSGKIQIDGLSSKDNPEDIRRRIGVVTHQTFLYGNLTAYENLEFYSRLYDVPDHRKRIDEVVGMMAMTSRLHHRVSTLSRGMQQRLSVARSLLHKPLIMLLDEPETGLDQPSIAMLWQAMQAEGETKRTIVFTTHNLKRGLEVGQRLLILDKGKLVFEGSGKSLELSALEEIYQDKTSVEG